MTTGDREFAVPILSPPNGQQLAGDSPRQAADFRQAGVGALFLACRTIPMPLRKRSHRLRDQPCAGWRGRWRNWTAGLPLSRGSSIAIAIICFSNCWKGGRRCSKIEEVLRSFIGNASLRLCRLGADWSNHSPMPSCLGPKLSLALPPLARVWRISFKQPSGFNRSGKRCKSFQWGSGPRSQTSDLKLDRIWQVAQALQPASRKECVCGHISRGGPPELVCGDDDVGPRPASRLMDRGSWTLDQL